MSSRKRRVEWHLLVLLSVATALAGCAKGFQPRNFANPEALFRASLLEFQRRHWDNAKAGFEQLASDLSARDPLLAPAYFYLAMSHEQQKEFLLAAQAYERIVDGFPADTLAPAAMLAAGRSYQRMWRRPTLDPEYGEKAEDVFRALLSSYPDAKQADEARTRLLELDEWFAKKAYLIGMHYVRVRGAYDSGIIYFKDVVSNYPDTKVARDAWLRLHEMYTKIRWKDDAAETCQAMWKTYPGDPDVLEACGAAKVDSAKADSIKATESVKPPPTIPVPDAFARPGPR
jgi:outer membrane protein assembly factor BamD